MTNIPKFPPIFAVQSIDFELIDKSKGYQLENRHELKRYVFTQVKEMYKTDSI